MDDVNGALGIDLGDHGALVLPVRRGLVDPDIRHWLITKAGSRNARKVWRAAAGYRRWWLPGVIPGVVHHLNVGPAERRWRHDTAAHQLTYYLTAGVLPDGTWWVEDHSRVLAWPDEATAMADVEQRMAGDPERWTEV